MPIGLIYRTYRNQFISIWKSVLSMRPHFKDITFLIILLGILVTDTQRHTYEFNLRYNARHSFSVRCAFKPRIYAHILCVKYA